MSSWQNELLTALAATLPGADITPYGSVTVPESLDGWSDLDVVITSPQAFDLEEALRGRLWAFQSTEEGESQLVRAVLSDGRRIDLTLRGASASMPSPPTDNPVRFDAALAAVRLGCGNHLIGVHLLLGILREALVHRMVAADQALGMSHHRLSTPYDADAAVAQNVLAAPLGPQRALDVYELCGAWRAAAEPGYTPDPSGLWSVIERGRP